MYTNDNKKPLAQTIKYNLKTEKHTQIKNREQFQRRPRFYRINSFVVLLVSNGTAERRVRESQWDWATHDMPLSTRYKQRKHRGCNKQITHKWRTKNGKTIVFTLLYFALIHSLYFCHEYFEWKQMYRTSSDIQSAMCNVLQHVNMDEMPRNNV